MKRLTPSYLCSLTALPSRLEHTLQNLVSHPLPVKRLSVHKNGVLVERVGHFPFNNRTVGTQPLMLRLGLPNTASGLKTGWLKNGVKLFLLNFCACCGSPRASGNGFGWLPVCLSNPKAPSDSYSGDVQAQHPRNGFAVATGSNLSSNRSSVPSLIPFLRTCTLGITFGESFNNQLTQYKNYDP